MRADQLSRNVVSGGQVRNRDISDDDIGTIAPNFDHTRPVTTVTETTR